MREEGREEGRKGGREGGRVALFMFLIRFSVASSLRADAIETDWIKNENAAVSIGSFHLATDDGPSPVSHHNGSQYKHKWTNNSKIKRI